jgi:hypothetical protein
MLKKAYKRDRLVQGSGGIIESRTMKNRSNRNKGNVRKEESGNEHENGRQIETNKKHGAKGGAKHGILRPFGPNECGAHWELRALRSIACCADDRRDDSADDFFVNHMKPACTLTLLHILERSMEVG